MTAPTCPRCHREVPELTAFCAGCGAPLLLREEAPAAPVDAPLDLDRRSRGGERGERGEKGGRPRVDLPGPAATWPPVARPAPTPRGAGPRADELAAVEKSSWDLGAVAAAAAREEPAVGGKAPRKTVAGQPRNVAVPPVSTAGQGPTAPATPTSTPTASTSTSTSTTTTTTATSSTTTATSTTTSTSESGLDDLPEPDVEALEVHVERAEPWRRVVAWAVDAVPFLAAGGGLASVLLREAAEARGGPPRVLEEVIDLVSAERVIALSILAAVVLALASYATLAHALGGATLGKRLVGLRVVGPDGNPPSPARSAARSLVAVVSAGLLGLGFLLALFTRSGRALHDLVARTWVVKAP